MAVADDNWQTKRSNISERIKFLFQNELLSDVKLVVPVSNDQSESRKIIPSHKFVLAISSPVFYAMFYGQMAETTDFVELPDCDYESLLELFRYLYSDEVKLTGSNVMPVLYLAKKYMVPSLADKCTEYLRVHLGATNVFSILPYAQKFEVKDLEDQCWEVIELQTEKAVTSDGFDTLERSLLESLVKRERLNVKEVELFKAVDRWATKEIERQGITDDSNDKRKIIGEDIVKAIRFPVMSQKEFISVVPDCNILTTKEIVDTVKHFNNVLTSPLPFSAFSRINIINKCHRFEIFKTAESGPWNYLHGKPDRICFTVDKDIHLFGVQHFGRESRNYKASVELKKLKNANDYLIVKILGSYSSEAKRHDAKNYYGFDVLFDHPVRVKQNDFYELVSLVEGDSSEYGESGKTTVECCGVVFTFSNSKEQANSNQTKVKRGQFPALLFSA